MSDAPPAGTPREAADLHALRNLVADIINADTSEAEAQAERDFLAQFEIRPRAAGPPAATPEPYCEKHPFGGCACAVPAATPGQREARLRSVLQNLVAAHDGYRQGVGPCLCAAHEDARAVLAAAPPRAPDEPSETIAPWLADLWRIAHMRVLPANTQREIERDVAQIRAALRAAPPPEGGKYDDPTDLLQRDYRECCNAVGQLEMNVRHARAAQERAESELAALRAVPSGPRTEEPTDG